MQNHKEELALLPRPGLSRSVRELDNLDDCGDTPTTPKMHAISNKSKDTLRQWQEGLVAVFEQAVLPATQHLFDLVRSHSDIDPPELLENKLQNYYQESMKRTKVHEREIVWGPDERKIETLLLSPPIDGKRFLRAQYQAATGAGKTRSMVELVRVHMRSSVRVNQNCHPLYVVVELTLQLVKQTYDALIQIDGLDCFCVCSDTSIPSKSKQEAALYVEERKKPTLIVTTKNSSAGINQPEGMDGNGLLDIFSQRGIVVDLLLLDESHLLAGEANNKIQKETYVKNAESAMLKISFTATPSATKLPVEKSNGFYAYSEDFEESFFCQNDVHGVFGPVMYRYSYAEALQDGVVVPLHLHLLNNSLPEAGSLHHYLRNTLEGWDKRNLELGEWPQFVGSICIDPLDATTPKQRACEETSWRCERLLMVFHMISEIASGNQTHVLAFCSLRTKRAKKLTALVKFVCKRLIDDIIAGESLFGYKEGSLEHQRISLLYSNCYYDVSGSGSCASGKNGIQPFIAAKIGFLANVDRVTVGSDIPQLTGIWFPDVKHQSNPQKLIQCMGRGTRTADSKSHCVIFLPCFVTDAYLGLEQDERTKQTLDKLQSCKASTWEGKFGSMATSIFDFFKQNHFDGDGLEIHCVLSKDICNPVSPTQISITGAQRSGSNAHVHAQDQDLERDAFIAERIETQEKTSGLAQFSRPRPSSVSLHFRHGRPTGLIEDTVA